jgi:hypothetical protein
MKKSRKHTRRFKKTTRKRRITGGVITNGLISEEDKNTITEIIKKTILANKKNKWVYCEGDCHRVCSNFIKYEIGTTRYMKKVLEQSWYHEPPSENPEPPSENPKKIVLKIVNLNDSELNEEQLDKEWAHMFGKTKIKIMRGNTDITDDFNKGLAELVIGSGPSASGKTHFKPIIIEYIGNVMGKSLKPYLCIDGGDYRDLSEYYKFINETIKVEKGKVFGG